MGEARAPDKDNRKRTHHCRCDGEAADTDGGGENVAVVWLSGHEAAVVNQNGYLKHSKSISALPSQEEKANS